MSNDVDEKRKQRLEFMDALYRITDGVEMFLTTVDEVATEVDIDAATANKIAEYLVGEGLMRYEAMGGVIAISHTGVVKVERALSQPDIATEHFPPAINVIHIGRMEHSQISQGGDPGWKSP
jgi:predicted transcriptional regulator